MSYVVCLSRAWTFFQHLSKHWTGKNKAKKALLNRNQHSSTKKDKLFRSSSHLIFHHFSPFNCCRLVALKKGITQNICRLCVCGLMNKSSVEHFMCLDHNLQQPTCDCRCFVHPISLAVNGKTRLIAQIRSAIRFMALCSPMQLFVTLNPLPVGQTTF